MNKKILSILILVLTLSFSTQAFASLTFTTDAITGTSASTIDLGAGNNLLLQTSGGNVGIGTTTPLAPLQVNGEVYLGGTGYGAIRPNYGRLFLRADAGSTFDPGLVFQDTDFANKVVLLQLITDGTDAGTSFGIYNASLGLITNFTNNGNVGVGVAAPSQKLEVNGGVRLNTVTVKPTCGATVRGTFWAVQGGAGVKDNVEVCAKDAGDAYAWRTLY